MDNCVEFFTNITILANLSITSSECVWQNVYLKGYLELDADCVTQINMGLSLSEQYMWMSIVWLPKVSALLKLCMYLAGNATPYCL